MPNSSFLENGSTTSYRPSNFPNACAHIFPFIWAWPRSISIYQHSNTPLGFRVKIVIFFCSIPKRDLNRKKTTTPKRRSHVDISNGLFKTTSHMNICLHIFIINLSVYFRLTPTYMFVLLFMHKLVNFLSEGPLWHPEILEYRCRKYWWTNLLYINNFYPTSFVDQVKLIAYLKWRKEGGRLKWYIDENRIFPVEAINK